ncbi:methylenetetrahydrofolate reductase [Halomarina rubra]|uniref:Methylenetetrahydrofolate reductase n=1 Tax=Halomarina rubra TaxID=2071873 RepID=A0ABD6AYG2_9EURY|nr:methylenetetrahydrofolate reductase [Halomarina rubra]
MSLESSVADTAGVGELLTNARFELMPFESFDEEITYLPEDATIAITTSPQLGIERTVERSEQAAAAGFDVSPHIAARYVTDRDHLDDIAGRLVDAGITDVFVPGGDREEPAGEFESAYDLLAALDDLGYDFAEVGITGYPEGHAFIDEQTLADSMQQKLPFATYVVTQLCYDPEAIVDWVETLRERGVDLPVEVGIPGVMKYQRLLKISQKVGVGDSVKFLQKTTGIVGFVKQLVGSRGTYTPDDLVDGLAPYATDDAYGISGLHIYTFNETADTEEWRRGRLS